MVAGGVEVGPALRALEDQAGRGLVRGGRDGRIEERLVGDDPVRLQAAGGGEHHLRLRVLDALGEFVGREAAEHHRMHRAEPGAGEHPDHRLGHHRHVDHHPVALADAEVGEHGGERGDLVAQRAVGDRPLGAGDGRIVDDRDLVAALGFRVPVDGIVAGVEPAIREPAPVGALGPVEGPFRHPVPGDGAGGVQPERFGVARGGGVGFGVAARWHGVSSGSLDGLPPSRAELTRSPAAPSSVCHLDLRA